MPYLKFEKMIPQREMEYFKKFCSMYTKSLALSNLEKEDIDEAEKKFRALLILLQTEFYDDAHKMMGHYVMELQAKRGIDGFNITLEE